MCLVNSQNIEIENYKISSMAERELTNFHSLTLLQPFENDINLNMIPHYDRDNVRDTDPYIVYLQQ